MRLVWYWFLVVRSVSALAYIYGQYNKVISDECSSQVSENFHREFVRINSKIITISKKGPSWAVWKVGQILHRNPEEDGQMFWKWVCGPGAMLISAPSDVLCKHTCYGRTHWVFIVTLAHFICASNLSGTNQQWVPGSPPAFISHLVSFASQPGYMCQTRYILANKGRNQPVFNPRHPGSV